jgi:hypothetical protein
MLMLTGGGPPAWGLGERLITRQYKEQLIMKFYTGPRASSCEKRDEHSGSRRGGEFLD